jgi:hypothetical protein
VPRIVLTPRTVDSMETSRPGVWFDDHADAPKGFALRVS